MREAARRRSRSRAGDRTHGSEDPLRIRSQTKSEAQREGRRGREVARGKTGDQGQEVSQILDASGRSTRLSSSTQPVLTIVLEGRTLDFGANTQLIDRLPLESRKKILEILTAILLKER